MDHQITNIQINMTAEACTIKLFEYKKLLCTIVKEPESPVGISTSTKFKGGVGFNNTSEILFDLMSGEYMDTMIEHLAPMLIDGDTQTIEEPHPNAFDRDPSNTEVSYDNTGYFFPPEELRDEATHPDALFFENQDSEYDVCVNANTRRFLGVYKKSDGTYVDISTIPPKRLEKILCGL
jgi:hypothetical protein